MKQLTDLEKTDSTEEFYSPNKTIYNGRRNACVHFKTDTDKFNIFV